MFALFVKEPCKPGCGCRKENTKKECKCQQQYMLEIPPRNNPPA